MEEIFVVNMFPMFFKLGCYVLRGESDKKKKKERKEKKIFEACNKLFQDFLNIQLSRSIFLFLKSALN